MTKTAWKAGTMLYPLPPVMVTCGTAEKPNVFTAAWTGIVCSDPAMTYISVRPSRYSHELIRENGEFVINLTTAKMLKAADFCGVKSGRDTDKFTETGLTLQPCQKVKVPMIEQSPLSLECRVTEIKTLGSHDMFLAQIVGVNVEDELLGRDGTFELEKSGLIAFCHGGYYALGGKLGTFGFSVAKKKSRKQRITEIKAERRSFKRVAVKAVSETQSDEEELEHPARKPFKKFNEKPYEKREDRPFKKAGDKPFKKDGERSYEKREERPFKKTGDKPFKKAGERSYEKREDRPFKKAGDKPFKKTGERPFKKYEEKPFGKKAGKPFKKAGRN